MLYMYMYRKLHELTSVSEEELLLHPDTPTLTVLGIVGVTFF